MGILLLLNKSTVILTEQPLVKCYSKILPMVYHNDKMHFKSEVCNTQKKATRHNLFSSFFLLCFDFSFFSFCLFYLYSYEFGLIGTCNC